MQHHDERLVPPAPWWLGAAVFALAWGWLVLVVAGPVPAIVVSVLLTFAVAGALWAYGGALRVVVDSGGVRAGRATLSAEHVGAVETLDAAAMREWHGPLADARAWLVHRAYVPTGVRIDVDDPSDPTPYWLVSSRRPRDLKSALDALRASGTTDRAEQGDTDGTA